MKYCILVLSCLVCFVAAHGQVPSSGVHDASTVWVYAGFLTADGLTPMDRDNDGPEPYFSMEGDTLIPFALIRNLTPTPQVDTVSCEIISFAPFGVVYSETLIVTVGGSQDLTVKFPPWVDSTTVIATEEMATDPLSGTFMSRFNKDGEPIQPHEIRKGKCGFKFFQMTDKGNGSFRLSKVIINKKTVPCPWSITFAYSGLTANGKPDAAEIGTQSGSINAGDPPTEVSMQWTPPAPGIYCVFVKITVQGKSVTEWRNHIKIKKAPPPPPIPPPPPPPPPPGGWPPLPPGTYYYVPIPILPNSTGCPDSIPIEIVALQLTGSPWPYVPPTNPQYVGCTDTNTAYYTVFVPDSAIGKDSSVFTVIAKTLGPSGIVLNSITYTIQPTADTLTGSIAGMKFNDLNSNGVRDTLEPGLANWKIMLSGAVAETTMTDSSGNYSFSGLSPGSYCVKEELKPGWTQTYPDSFYCITIDSSETHSGLDFGNHQTQILVSVDIHVKDKWNIISNPLEVADPRTIVLFPTAMSNAYRYDNGYVLSDSILRCLGFWLKFSGDQTVTIIGKEVVADTCELLAGWNLLGSVSDTVQTSSITTIPPAISLSNFYGYDNGYYVASMIVPGFGYWVKAGSSGQIILNSAASVPPKTIEWEGKLNEIEIRDASGAGQALFFAPEYVLQGTLDQLNVGSNDFMKKFELPPRPPDDLFSAQFASGRMIELTSDGQVTLDVLLTSAKPPLTLKWNMKDGMTAAVHAGKEKIPLASTGSVVVREALTRLGLEVNSSDQRTLPTAYALYQNYPNPFNPMTTIRFDLPEAANVSLKVFNLLGQEVAALVSNRSMNRGSHTVSFDASSLANGAYLYRLVANDYRDEKVMILLK